MRYAPAHPDRLERPLERAGPKHAALHGDNQACDAEADDDDEIRVDENAAIADQAEAKDIDWAAIVAGGGAKGAAAAH